MTTAQTLIVSCAALMGGVLMMAFVAVPFWMEPAIDLARELVRARAAAKRDAPPPTYTIPARPSFASRVLWMLAQAAVTAGMVYLAMRHAR